eukprot:a177275_154.p1 GENE.a177275_154~~a177275_154.p1  ORF type:complete len:190 (-),score=59.47 a177275_154:229-765(-)
MAAVDYDDAVGLRLRVTTTLGETFEQTLFAYDRETELAVFQDTSGFPKRNVRVLKTEFIRDVAVTGEHSDAESKHLEIRPIVVADIRRRERLNVQQEEAAAARIGEGVSAFAQAVFDAMSKTYACTWDGETIVVLGVRIAPPYSSETCTDGESTASLARIKKVLDAERRKIQQRTGEA